MRTRNQEYLYNLAFTMLNQFPLDELMRLYEGTSPQMLYEKFGERVRAQVRLMRPETRGAIADRGLAFETRPNTSLYEVHCETYLGKYQSGRDLLIEIAVTAIIAKMYDILRDHGYRDRGYRDRIRS